MGFWREKDIDRSVERILRIVCKSEARPNKKKESANRNSDGKEKELVSEMKIFLAERKIRNV